LEVLSFFLKQKKPFYRFIALRASRYMSKRTKRQSKPGPAARRAKSRKSSQAIQGELRKTLDRTEIKIGTITVEVLALGTIRHSSALDRARRKTATALAPLWGTAFHDINLTSTNDITLSIPLSLAAPPTAGSFVSHESGRPALRSPTVLNLISPDLLSAKDELSKQYLTSENARSLTAEASGASPVPEINVIGVGIGEKISDGVGTNTIAVKLFVQKKYPKISLSSDHLLPASISGLPVDVEQVGILRPLGDGPNPGPLVDAPNPRLQFTPARPGCSIGFDFVAGQTRKTAGTFGALVRDAAGDLYVLSNSHVLAHEGRLPRGAPIFQAGLLDLPPGAGKREVATLSDFVRYDAGPLKVDAAIAKGITPELLSSEILGIGAPQGVAPAQVDMIVHKFGRTTGYTVGRVSSVATDVTLPFETGAFTFVNQIVIDSLSASMFSDGGDSGALLLDRRTNAAVGLLFGGSRTHTFANHLSDVLQALNVTLA
jgi:hypothetical protein